MTKFKDSYDNNRWKKIPDDYQDYGFELTYNNESFEEWWAEIEEFAAHNHMETSYVEDEFVIDGELKYVYLQFPGDEYTGADER